ncbi:hypothetical protein MCOR19_003457 [Pyricularia oryzae]|nr:hypothetical protein MCOR19_003457 [Pyricularia oryzae]KAI6309258.1 hypothetical protein MCOR34_006865 [Pyricularia oryzae]KAI6348800.1 hypothetical protein MCOR30_000068 [Pyricularia oryzae]KAI6469258.1 hypothetical protein MCOR17_003879 [Pyricularia oryzae]
MIMGFARLVRLVVSNTAAVARKNGLGATVLKRSNYAISAWSRAGKAQKSIEQGVVLSISRDASGSARLTSHQRTRRIALHQEMGRDQELNKHLTEIDVEKWRMKTERKPLKDDENDCPAPAGSHYCTPEAHGKTVSGQISST